MVCYIGTFSTQCGLILAVFCKMSDSEDDFSLSGLTQESRDKSSSASVNFSLLMKSAAQLAGCSGNIPSDFGDHVNKIVESQFSDSSNDDLLAASLDVFEAGNDPNVIPPTPQMPILSLQVVSAFYDFY